MRSFGGHPALLACAAYFLEPEQYEDLLQRVNLSMDTVELFSVSDRRWIEAVDFSVSESKNDATLVVEAGHCCVKHGDQRRAAAIYEQAGMLEKAGNAYRAAKMYRDAMRCATAAGDSEGIARTHEALGELEQALDIWTKLGKKREQNRVKKRMEIRASLRERMIEIGSSTSDFESAEVGSSMTMSRSSKVSARAIATSCYLATERPSNWRSSSTSTPKRLSVDAACPRICFQFTMWRHCSMFRVTTMFSATVRFGKREKSW